MTHIWFFFCFKLNAGTFKTVEVRMDIEIRADLKCSVFPNNQLFKSDNGKGPPQAVNDIIDDLISSYGQIISASISIENFFL